MSFGQVVLPSSVGGTVEWSSEKPVHIAPDVGEVSAREIKIQEVFEELLHPG